MSPRLSEPQGVHPGRSRPLLTSVTPPEQGWPSLQDCELLLEPREGGTQAGLGLGVTLEGQRERGTRTWPAASCSLPSGEHGAGGRSAGRGHLQAPRPSPWIPRDELMRGAAPLVPMATRPSPLHQELGRGQEQMSEVEMVAAVTSPSSIIQTVPRSNHKMFILPGGRGPQTAKPRQGPPKRQLPAHTVWPSPALAPGLPGPDPKSN
ncbi:Hypothetical predicted protein [Marmota monax]|uniref:Uncharacterized protein n=1 Tax=Marmota monax TaxID=9995 RepID=A0A5E4CLY3_MARMO|nr:Hypothetical predicted protein [Marmota monax]